MRVLNFGSLNMDHVYRVEHLVTPGETISAGHLERHCGGKGLNQSIALARAGAQVFHAGSVGADGARLTDTLSRNGVDTRWVRLSEEATGHAVIQVDRNAQNGIFLFGGANRDIRPDFVAEVFRHFTSDTLVILQNEISCMPEIMRAAAANGLPIALNPSPFTDAVLDYPLAHVRWFAINEIEGRQLTGESDPKAICAQLRGRYPGAGVLLTAGERGGWLMDGDVSMPYAARRVKVVDTTGAGDTFTGYFFAAVLRGAPHEAALREASAAAALAVSRHGAASSIPAREEVLAALDA